jgi:hypothetical protein
LAGVLLHEADHALCHDELDAFGEELAFYKTLNNDFNKFFPGASPQEKGAIESKKRIEKSNAKRQREAIAGRGGSGYGEGHRERTEYRVPRLDVEDLRGIKLQEEVSMNSRALIYPGRPNSRVLEHMNCIANALFQYRDCEGQFPGGSNADMVAALRAINLCPFRLDELNDKREVIDPWGSAYVYRVPGAFFPDEFDLYSVGPCREDRNGGEGNILCELHRR